jgi:hypothetical protein
MKLYLNGDESRKIEVKQVYENLMEEKEWDNPETSRVLEKLKLPIKTIM